MRATESTCFRRVASVAHFAFSCLAVRSCLSYKCENILLFVYFQLNSYSIEDEQTAYDIFTLWLLWRIATMIATSETEASTFASTEHVVMLSLLMNLVFAHWSM